MATKITKIEFEERINILYKGNIDVSEFNFIRTADKGKCICKICGNVWYPRAYSLLAGHGCRKCYDKRNSEQRIINIDKIEDKINEKNDIKIIGKYIDTKHSCEVKCGKCGYIWKTKPVYLINGHGCPKCYKLSQYSHTEEEIKNILINKFGDEKYDFSNLNYKGDSSNITIECKKHGHFNTLTKRLLNIKQNEICPHCQQEIKNEKERLRIEKLTNKEKIVKDTKIKLTKEEKIQKQKEKLINKFKEIYGEDKFDYNSLEYVNYRTNISLICKEHGLFNTKITTLLKGNGCPKCSHQSKKYSTEEWIKKAQKIHPDFTYNNTVYKDKSSPLVVTCPIHNNISVYPNTFLREKCPCAKCRQDIRNEEKSQKYWNRVAHICNEYNYEIISDKCDIKSDSKIELKCVKHNLIFKPSVHNFISNGSRCPQCGIEKNMLNRRLDIGQLKERINKIHNNKFDLSLITEYKNTDTKLPIICPEHGLIYMTAHSLLSGQGCQKCGNKQAGLKIRLTQEEFINRAKEVHLNKDFDFSKTIYTLNNEKVIVTCKTHGDFEIIAANLLLGNGCPKCNMSHLENKIMNILIKNEIKYKWQTRKTDFVWLGLQSLDFYLPEYNIAIECQGEQHFVANFFKIRGVDYAENLLKNVQERDKRKKQLCKENGVKLVYYLSDYFVKYLEEDDIYFTNEEELVKYILSCDKNIVYL